MPFPPPGGLPGLEIEPNRVSCVSCIRRWVFFNHCAAWEAHPRNGGLQKNMQKEAEDGVYVMPRMSVSKGWE